MGDSKQIRGLVIAIYLNAVQVLLLLQDYIQALTLIDHVLGVGDIRNRIYLK